MYCETGAEMCVMSCPGGNCKLHCDGAKCKRDCFGGGCERSGAGEEVGSKDKPTVTPKGHSPGVVCVNLFLLLTAMAYVISAYEF